MNLKELKKEIPYKFKPQSIKYGKAIMVAYIDARDAQDLLDEVVGPENWQTDYKVINENLYAGVGIKINDEWVTKWDCGVESNQEAEKGEASDAFKRACVQWGIGRFLYRLGVVELPTKEYNGKERPATHDGKILWSNDEISDYIKSGAANKKPASKQASDPNKYAKPIAEPSYTNPCKEETMKKVAALNKGGVKGKECIKKYLDEYNTSKKTNYKLADLSTDEKLNSIIDFINNISPEV